MKTHHDHHSFKNPWSSNSFRSSAAAILKGPLTRGKPFHVEVEPAKTVPVDWSLYSSPTAHEGICTTWLGHAGFLVQLLDGTRIVFDPIFSERASPSTWIGPRRWLAAPCRASELPEVHFVAISHNHYDHCELQALKDISARSPNVRFLVPLGVKKILVEELEVTQDRVKEMYWWDSVIFDGEKGARTEFVCTPAQHNSGRTLLDQNHTLWASWVVRQLPPLSTFPTSSSLPIASIYHGGDTGYSTQSGACPVFAEIGDKYGPFDFAMIPIWRGASLSVLGRIGLRLTAEATHTLLSTLHASPKDAVSLARDVRARHSLGMHFGTFCGSDDESREPLVELVEALLVDPSLQAEATLVEKSMNTEDETKTEAGGRRSVLDLRESWKEEGGFGIVDVGQTVVLPVQ